LEALRFQRPAHLCSELQNDFAFAKAAGTTGARVGAAVGWIKNDSI
jgi:hypothetical protein